ncbi:MAG: GGDEF domain-containing protein [Parvularcula sp.]|jgi:diguanylate cyclase (GGDEF)-like protein|nr:GGDEF domain-containing protein [Parvularcula sp.]
MTTSQILALANPLLCATFSIAFFVLWSRDRAVQWIAIIGVSYLLSTLGFSVFHFTADPNGVPSIVTMHIFYSVGSIALVWGICMRAGQKVELRMHLAIAVMALVLMVGASYGQDYNARLYAANACYGLIMALGSQTAARQTDKDTLDKAILFLLALGAFQLFTRPLVAIIIEGPMTAEQYRETPFYAVMVIWLAISSMLMAMSLLIAALTAQMKAQQDDALQDPLTGLKTRGPFEEQAMNMIERSQQEGYPTCVVVADLDHFKAVNDTFGHQVGDSAIATFGRIVAEQIRAGDAAGRIGGEEFCIVLWNCEESAAKSMAERVRRALARANVEGMPESMRLTASFGVSQHRGGEGYVKLFARADAALYEAKKNGRDCVKVGGRSNNVAPLTAQPVPKVTSA